MNYDEKLCDEKHKVLEKAVDMHENRLDEHDDKISALEQYKSGSEKEIDNLCEKIDKLIANNNKWFYAVTAGMASLLVKLLFFK